MALLQPEVAEAGHAGYGGHCGHHAGHGAVEAVLVRRRVGKVGAIYASPTW